MKHLILGNGNLGKDIFLEINARRLGEPKLLSKSKGLDVQNISAMKAVIEEMQPDHVWYCVGGGSVNESKMDHPLAKLSMELNAITPIRLAEMLPERIRLTVFSTDYVADESRTSNPFVQSPFMRSQYAMNKAYMEGQLKQMNRPNTSVIRVGSLYGVHNPENTFPGKILQNYANNDLMIKLPSNIVVPTPTRWAAAVMLSNPEELFCSYGTLFHHCAPEGGVSVKDWAKFILRGFRADDAFHWGKDFFDTERPLFSGLGTSFGDRKDYWFDLWTTYFNPEWFLKKASKTP